MKSHETRYLGVDIGHKSIAFMTSLHDQKLAAVAVVLTAVCIHLKKIRRCDICHLECCSLIEYNTTSFSLDA